jgi:secondary thiamine-phosphate synthase enzyme
MHRSGYERMRSLLDVFSLHGNGGHNVAAYQETLHLRTRGRGLRDLTDDVAAVIKRSGLRLGNAVVFCQHTSCSLVIMENADPSAQADLEAYFERIAPDGDPRYSHDAEGPDDMSAHLRMALTRTSETIPFSDGHMLLGTWQGVYLWEHRTSPHSRSILVSVLGDP